MSHQQFVLAGCTVTVTGQNAERVVELILGLAPPARPGVFGYLDEQVRKDMSGFYDAFGMQQPGVVCEADG